AKDLTGYPTITSSITNNHFKNFTYNDNFKTTGVGVNGIIGIIYRPKDYVRLGLSIHTPTYYVMTDTRSSDIAVNLENPVYAASVTSATFTRGVDGEAKYTQMSPWKAIISGSYVFREVANVKKQKGFITADIEYVNYRGSMFGSNNESPTQDEKNYYKSLNSVIKQYYKGNFNFRVGGELKFNVIMARLGFAYYTNPYKDAELKANKMLLSGGLGYRNKGMFIDLTYVHNISKDVNFPYRLEDRPNTFASVKDTRGSVTATLGFKF
ncbi:MAG: aromatic hydrocarbon degradation protein, partial [Ferruginibacter sp.]